MPDPVKVVGTYKGGMKRDFAREDLPSGAFWNMVDILPEVIDGRARKRGGYEHVSQQLSTVQATTSYVTAGIFAPFSDGSSILAFDEDGRAYEIESTTGTEDIGAAVTTRTPVFYNDMVIVPDSSGAASPKKITRSSGTHTIASLGGSPPAGRYAIVFKDVVWLAAPAATGKRIFFCTAGDPESWDTTVKWMDASFPITGMAALQNAVFVFGKERTMRVRGSIPPPDTDFIVDDPIFDIGCTDSRSITTYRDKLIWGNASGIFITDGSIPEDLTRLCGMKAWWLDVMGGREGFSTGTPYDESTWSIVSEIYGDYLLYSVMNGSTEVDSGLIDLVRFSWFRLKNVDAISAWRRPYPEELFWGRRGASYVAKTSPFFTPSAALKADADGSTVLPEFETGFFMDDSLLKTIRRVFFTYDIRDAGSDDPTLSLSYITSPEETSYTAVGGGVLPETMKIDRQHRFVNQPMRGIGFKVAQANASSDTRFYDLEVEVNRREGYR